MLALSDAAGRELRWVVVWSKLLPLGAELRDGDDTFVSIRFHLDQSAEATTARHHRVLWKVGFLRQKLLIAPERKRESALVFPLGSRGRGGSFEPRPGVVLDLRRTGIVRPTWEWRDGMETPIVRFGGSKAASNESGDVSIRSDAFSHPDLDLLVVLGYVVASLAVSG